MGGYGALLIGLKHPEQFKFIADISGVINAPCYDIPLTSTSPLNYVINSLRISFGDEKSADRYQAYGAGGASYLVIYRK